MDVARIAISDDEQRLLVVYAIQRLLALAPDESTLLREVCTLLARYRHYRCVWAGCVEPDGSVPVVARAGEAAAYLDTISARWDDTPDGAGNIGWVVRSGKPMVFRVSEPVYARWRQRAQSFGIVSLLSLPLRSDEGVWGVITAYSDEPEGFGEKERRLLIGLADDIARTLQLLRVRADAASEAARSRNRLHRLEAVRRLFVAGAGELDARTALLLNEGARSLGLAVGALGTIDGEVIRYRLYEADSVASQQRHAVAMKDTVAAVVTAAGRTCTWEDLTAGTLAPTTFVIREGFRSAIATPFDAEGRGYVLVFLGRRARPVPFQEEDHVYVELLASLFAQFVRQSLQQEQIRNLQAFDQLTGLPNRASLESRLAETLALRDPAQRPFAVICIDLDRFRGINTALGFAIGDRLLSDCAERLRGALREGDYLARVDGDAFGVIAEAPTPEAAADLARRLRDCVKQSATIDGNEVVISASLGIALSPSDARDPAEVLACATSATASARAEGGGRYHFYSREIGAALDAKRRFHRNVLRAREQHEFRLYYQPEIELRSGRVTGVEALLRWHDQERGVRNAAEFISLAEETGLIYGLDRWGLHTAMEQVQHWERAGRDLVIACNLSGRSLQEPALLGDLRALLYAASIDPAHLQIELTETVAMADAGATGAFLQECRALGLSVALDDFGTGYSSLMHLKRLPVDVIKIDGSFVRELPEREEDAAIVRAIIALGHSLGRHIVAECVEEEQQVRWLIEQGCDLAQGHWYAAAMPPEQLEAWMDGR
ncbi:GGDEF domain-containing protein [bacterium]|nr:MAG: GGDEF domain-containing protein [bacterium]